MASKVPPGGRAEDDWPARQHLGQGWHGFRAPAKKSKAAVPSPAREFLAQVCLPEIPGFGEFFGRGVCVCGWAEPAIRGLSGWCGGKNGSWVSWCGGGRFAQTLIVGSKRGGVGSKVLRMEKL